jgi:enoyl-CoA hydratase/carnithine racemase
MTVSAAKREHVAVVTIERPEAHNALDSATRNALASELERSESDDDIWAIVLTGAGDRAFSAGADLREVGGEAVDLDDLGGFASIVRRSGDKPLIAAVNGLALGGGFELMLACDLVVADRRAVFGIPEVSVGIMAGGGGVIRLAQRLPIALALEMAMTGRPITSERAYELGLINLVVDDDVVGAAVSLAQTICGNAPLAVRLSRRLAYDAMELPESALWELNRRYLEALVRSADAVEGRAAFVSHRRPTWSGQAEKGIPSEGTRNVS